MPKVTNALLWPHDQKWDGEGGTWIDYIMELRNGVSSTWENAKKGNHHETLLRRVKRACLMIYDAKISNKISWNKCTKLKEAIVKTEKKTMSKTASKAKIKVVETAVSERSVDEQVAFAEGKDQAPKAFKKNP